MLIYARLRDLQKIGQGSLLHLFHTSDNVGLNHIPQGYFERLLKRGRCVVLLDGLDEVMDQEAHETAVAEIRKLTAEYPDNWILVTCRVASWRNQLPDFTSYEIQEFNMDDVRHFIDSWYREVLRWQELKRVGSTTDQSEIQQVERLAQRNAQEPAERLWNSLKGNNSLLRIARTPLILSLITLVHYYRVTDLPKGRARLYEQCLNILLEEWDKQNKRLIPNDCSLNDKLLVLKRIAFQYYQENRLDMDSSELQALVQPLLDTLSVQISAKSLIDNICQRSGVIIEKVIGRYGFPHRALHDYLAARYIVEENMDDLLL